MKAKITFLGGDEETTGNVNSTTWGEGKDAIKFKVGEPVELDTDAPKVGPLNKHIIMKAQANRFFRVELVPSDTAVPDGMKKPVDDQRVTNIDHSKEAMKVDPPPTDKLKEQTEKQDQKTVSEATAASRDLAASRKK